MRLTARALENSQILISAQKGSVANIIANSNKYLITLASFQALVIVSTSSWAPKFLFLPTRSFFPLLRSIAHYLHTQHTHVYSVEEV